MQLSPHRVLLESKHLQGLYGIEISPELVSAVTDAALEGVARWQNRPLELVYAIVFFVRCEVKLEHSRILWYAANRFRALIASRSSRYWILRSMNSIESRSGRRRPARLAPSRACILGASD